MCLLIVVFGLDERWPLVVAANRDERLDRPALPMTVLQAAEPRILGGRDQLAGGTWLAVNEHGVVAGLTNRPRPGDPRLRSRGEIPLALASQPTAPAAVEYLAARFQPSDFNAAWLLVGDRDSLFSVDMTGDEVVVAAQDPGVHILENRPLGDPSPKLARVTSLVGDGTGPGVELVERLVAVLGDHQFPAELPSDENGSPRRPGSSAACVHLDDFGTRSSTIIRVPGSTLDRPEVRFAPGPPCVSGFVTGDPLWDPGADLSRPAPIPRG